MSTTIREAEWSELADVLALLRTCDLPVDGVEENLESFLVARENEALVGTIGLERYGDVGLLRSLAVASSGRGHGLGGRLVKMLLGYAKERGVTTIYLLTETAEAFFPRFGLRGCLAKSSTLLSRLLRSCRAPAQKRRRPCV